MSTLQELIELGDILKDVEERRKSWEEQKELLKMSESAERTLRELLDKVDELMGHMKDVTAGIDRANRARAGTLQDERQSMDQRLREALVELERSKAEVDKRRANENELRKMENEAYRDLRKEFRKALGPDAKDAADNAKRIVADEHVEAHDEGGSREWVPVQELDDVAVGEFGAEAQAVDDEDHAHLRNVPENGSDDESEPS